jgi:hypothetical protein
LTRIEEETMEENPILISYDGSEDARRAIAAAADLLSSHEAVVLDVTPPVTVEEEASLFERIVFLLPGDEFRSGRGLRPARLDTIGLSGVRCRDNAAVVQLRSRPGLTARSLPCACCLWRRCRRTVGFGR